MSDKEEIEKLTDGEYYIIPESDFGRAEVWRINDRYVLFEIPWLGGEPIYVATYHVREIESMLKTVDSWT